MPFDTNIDNWLFNIYGPLGTVFGFSWTLATLPTIPLQKALSGMGEVYYYHDNTVSFFQARQIDEDPKHPVGDGAGTVRTRWRMNGNYKFYLVSDIANKLNGQLEQDQKK